jgi:hypothetical protein
LHLLSDPLPPLAGWTRRFLSDGVILYAPDPAQAAVRIQERLTPLRTIEDILEGVLIGMTGRLTDIVPGAIERLVTDEGEHAAFVSISARSAEGPVDRSLAVVFGDDWYLKLSGTAMVPEFFEATRTITRAICNQASLGLGAIRERRFLYTAPPGWVADARQVGLATTWRPRDAADARVAIHVQAAKPLALGGAALLLDKLRHASALDAFVCEQRLPPDDVTCDAGLAGVCAHLVGTLAGDKLHVANAILSDAHFRYPLRLESGVTGLEEHLAIFRAVIASVQPVPDPRRTVAVPSGMLDYWVD